MSIDLTLVLVCNTVAIDELFLQVERYLASLDFVRVRRIFVSNHRDDPDNDEAQRLLIVDLDEELSHLDDWRSIYMEFNSAELPLGIQFDLDVPGSAGGYITIDMQTMYRLHKERIPMSFYDVIGGVAALSGAVGGYGGYGAADTPAPPEATLTELLADPENRDKWFDIHVVAASGLPGTSAPRAWAVDFERVERRGFVFFISRVFLDMCRKFG
jgi:hypothetical protein